MRRFVIIDDDPINNHICAKYIDLVFTGANVLSYTNPQLALDHIITEYRAGTLQDTIMLLDINMPVLTGWDVLDQFSAFPAEIINQFVIYILSSSIASEDKTRADENSLVSGFLEKPLSVEQIQAILQ